jgi:hypothetical protein
LASTGNKANDHAWLWLSTTNSATAPPGGCKQRNPVMTAKANTTATAPANVVSGISSTQATPTHADKVLPPTTDQGCAKGLDGVANTSKALAPIGATSHTPETEASP